jgi:archaellum biogenesis ATPase FlaH
LEGEVDGDVINNIFDRHATDWSVKMNDYFFDIASQFSLLWDTEYDVYIEDCLYGCFTFQSHQQILSIMKAIKILAAQNVT